MLHDDAITHACMYAEHVCGSAYFRLATAMMIQISAWYVTSCMQTQELSGVLHQIWTFLHGTVTHSLQIKITLHFPHVYSVLSMIIYV